MDGCEQHDGGGCAVGCRVVPPAPEVRDTRDSPLHEAYYSACGAIDRLEARVLEFRNLLARHRERAEATLALTREFARLLGEHREKHIELARGAHDAGDDWLEGFHLGGADQCEALAAIVGTLAELVGTMSCSALLRSGELRRATQDSPASRPVRATETHGCARDEAT